MVMSVPVYTHMLNKAHTLEEVHAAISKFYEGQRFVKVMPLDASAGEGNMLAGNACSGWDGLRIFVTGNDERIVLSSQFDNLGKGASGAAIQCLNIMLGCDEATGLSL
ncbi:MAG: N-acetyl-gamma-glutamyl-phosphate reductase, partial [Lachnospiraceae bacterium]|nr:N-acetyl-gamma-glutamyl-phosphate reductase [Lachnospiraceae bacterium]